MTRVMIGLLLFLALRASTGADVTPNVPSLPLSGSNLEAPYAAAAPAATPQTDVTAPVAAPTGSDAMASPPAPSSWWSWLSPAPAAAPEEPASTPSGVPAPGPAADMAPGPAPSETHSGPAAAPSGSFLRGGTASPTQVAQGVSSPSASPPSSSPWSWSWSAGSASPSPNSPSSTSPSSSPPASPKGRTCANRDYTASPNGHPPPPPSSVRRRAPEARQWDPRDRSVWTGTPFSLLALSKIVHTLMAAMSTTMFLAVRRRGIALQ